MPVSAVSVASANAVEASRASARVTSLDIVRGIAMILMAIDHVRVYSGVPAGGLTFGVFFTRWITNFVAPTFVFLAGTSAYLYGRKYPDRWMLSKFLTSRGVWLIFLELTFLRIAWTFNLDFRHYLLAGVIWMLGWSMIALAAAVYLPRTAIATLGIALIALHNLTNLFGPQIAHAFGADGPNWLLRILYFGGVVEIGKSGPSLFILYVLVPWVGLMFAGYAFGRITEKQAEQRRRIYLRLGVALTALFVALRLIGPMFIVWALAEGWTGPLARVIETFGRVPMFYYLLHIPLIHLAACIVSLIRVGHVDPWLFTNHPVDPGPIPAGYMWSLPLLYLVYAVCLVFLYFPCRWYAALKARRRSTLLSYV